jgi:hypothetical protein
MYTVCVFRLTYLLYYAVYTALRWTLVCIFTTVHAVKRVVKEEGVKGRKNINLAIVSANNQSNYNKDGIARAIPIIVYHTLVNYPDLRDSNRLIDTLRSPYCICIAFSLASTFY